MRWHLLRARAACLVAVAAAMLLCVCTAQPLLLRGNSDAGTRALASIPSIADLVKPYGYPLEEHHVTSPDGYITTLHRIPYAPSSSRTTSTASHHRRMARSSSGDAGGPHTIHTSSSTASSHSSASFKAASSHTNSDETRPVVYLSHGLLDCAAGFLLLGPGKALALLLADAGYDVWLTSARGTTYSRNHTSLKIDTPEYWAFSFDEMAKYDLPAQLDYIGDVTGQDRAAFIGFSQGGTVALAALSEQPELADRLSAAVLIAPATFLAHANSPPLAMLSRLDTPHAMQLLGCKEFLPSQALVQIMGGVLCIVQPHLCVNILAITAGFTNSAVDPAKLPTFLKYTPAGESVQNVLHWAQVMRSRTGGAPLLDALLGTHAARGPTLSHFDWGSDCAKPRRGGSTPMCNRLKYGSDVPPAYALGNVATPLMLVTGGQDRLADPQDIASLKRALGPGYIKAQLQVPSFQHLDFMWADSAAELVYKQVIDFLSQV